MEEQSQAYLATEKLGSLMRKYSVPCIISLLVAALYNIVDQIFIANADYLGSYGNAANTVVYPITVIALSIAVCVGDGCCAHVSGCLGRKDEKTASKTFGNAIGMAIIFSIIVCAIFLVFREPIITAFGGTVNAETYKYSQEYFFYISLGIPAYMFGQAMNPVIRADGSPRFAMISTVSGAMVNVIFDPLFIYGMHWGMMGAAVATVMGQILTAALAIWYLCHIKSVRLKKECFTFDIRVCGRIISLGMCSFLSQISLVASMAAINNMIRKYGAMDSTFGIEQYSQIPMAVVGIVMKFFQIIISIVIGMSAGCIPIVGYNMGADRKDRVKHLFTKLLIGEAIVGAVGTVIVECFPQVLIGIFGAANEPEIYTNFAVDSFRIYLCMLVLACINKATFIFLQAMGKAVASTMLSMIREIVFGVGWALLLPIYFGLYGVLYSMPVADILTAFVALILIVSTYRQLSSKSRNKTLKSAA